jgi:trehalose 6-phosphate phosphatase
MAENLPLIAPDWAVFLDIDGTLLDYAPTPDSVRVPPLLRETLAALGDELGGALALVTGRRIADVDRIFAPLHLPVAGQHGAEARRGKSQCVFAPVSTALEALLAPVYVFAAKHPAIHIEDKGLSAAVHYRGAEVERDALARLLEEAMASSGADFKLLPGHLVFDVIQRSVNKGSALNWFMTEPPFISRVPLFAGDERTDEDGFAAALARGGYAVRVGPPGDSIASWNLRAPQDLREWLHRSVTALRQDARCDARLV